MKNNIRELLRSKHNWNCPDCNIQMSGINKTCVKCKKPDPIKVAMGKKIMKSFNKAIKRDLDKIAQKIMENHKPTGRRMEGFK